MRAVGRIPSELTWELTFSSDPQLDAGIDHLMGLLEDWTWPKGRPAYPQRQGMGIAEEDK